jgi:hypothetical protein
MEGHIYVYWISHYKHTNQYYIAYINVIVYDIYIQSIYQITHVRGENNM